MLSIDKKLVLPGNYLCGLEEFSDGANTYVSDDAVFSAVCGQAYCEGHTVHVQGKINKLQTVDIIGGISDLTETCAFVVPVVVIPANTKRNLPESLSLPISRISRDYLRSIRDAVRIGDIVMARVVKADRRYELAFVTKEHGVVKAFCSHCRVSMLLKNYILICSNCGRSEKRKFSVEYGIMNVFSR